MNGIEEKKRKEKKKIRQFFNVSLKIFHKFLIICVRDSTNTDSN